MKDKVLQKFVVCHIAYYNTELDNQNVFELQDKSVLDFVPDYNFKDVFVPDYKFKDVFVLVLQYVKVNAYLQKKLRTRIFLKIFQKLSYSAIFS